MASHVPRRHVQAFADGPPLDWHPDLASTMTTAAEQLGRALAGHYVIERELGAGGMATVFLARDVRHARQVAIKVLRPELAERLGAERFLRETQTTATLHHPNIVPLYDSGEADGLLYYVMPYVEGETLRDRLRREGQLPVADAVGIACDIADALDYAHRRGVVHRDVKPENILLHERRALIADFGIALAAESSGGDPRLTGTGMSIGTPQYMSPEQAMGEKHVTARTDVFALGAMLYEMLAGEPPFTGETAQAIIAKLMSVTPAPIRDLRTAVPPHVGDAIDRALQKVAADRWATTAAFADALRTPTDGQRIVSGSRLVALPARRSAARIAAGAAVVVAIAAGMLWLGRSLGDRSASRALVARATIPLAQDQLLSISSYPLRLSQDGQFLVYIGDDSGKARLFLRPLGDTLVTLLPGTEGAHTPFFSPDGSWIAFFVEDKIRKVPRTGGAPIDIAKVSPWSEAGAEWADDGSIFYAVGDSALYQVPSTGGPPRAIIMEPTATAKRRALGGLRWPALLPDPARVLVSTDSGIGIMELASGEVHTLMRGRQARYLPTGHLLFDDNEGRIRVVGFDARSGALTGASVPVFEVYRGPGNGAGYFTVANTGTLVYAPGNFHRSLVRVDRNGRETPLNIEPRGYRFPAVSPDGKFVAVTVDPRPSTIWLIELANSRAVPLTTGAQHSIGPVWSPDGTRIAFTDYSTTGGRPVWMLPQPGSARTAILAGEFARRWSDVDLTDWTRSAGFLGFKVDPARGKANDEIVQFRMNDTVLTHIATSLSDDRRPTLSPDGKWLAYQSDMSGAIEVYVQPFPAGGASVLVSSRGGVEPRWSANGREIYYRNGTRIMAVAVQAGATFAVRGAPQLLFSGAYDFSQERNWSPSPDGTFIMVKGDPAMGRQLRVVFNWFEELKGAGRK
jgi:serine/threonine-protein kinase